MLKRDGENLKTHMSMMLQVKLNMIAVHQVGMQLLLLLEKLHSIGYLHRDIKPQNILVGEYKKVDTWKKIKLIDFGLCIPYTKDANLLRAPLNDSEHVLPGYCQADGNAFFASLNADKNKQLSRRDDLISLGYFLIYLANGIPPFFFNREGESSQEILRLQKLSMTPERICEQY